MLLVLAPDRRQNYSFVDYFERQLARLPSFPGQIVMSSPTRSGAGSGNEDDQDEVGATDLANSVIASKEVMSVLGSALADQVVGALQAQGLVCSQDQLFGGQSAMSPGGQPYHMMGRGFGYPIPRMLKCSNLGIVWHLSSFPQISMPGKALIKASLSGQIPQGLGPPLIGWGLLINLNLPLVKLGDRTLVAHHQWLLQLQVKQERRRGRGKMGIHYPCTLIGTLILSQVKVQLMKA